MQSEKIISIRKIGLAKTLDIEVNNKKHLFFADGIATSNSHGFCYGSISFATQWVKSHFPLHFYTAWLSNADEKIDPQQEMSDLIVDAKIHDVEVYPPSIKNLDNKHYDGNFTMTQKGVYFGINNVSKIGRQQTHKFIQAVRETERKLGKTIVNWSWYDILLNLTSLTTKTVVNNLIAVGMFSHLKETRREMLFEYSIWDSLNEREQEWCRENKHGHTNLLSVISTLVHIPRKQGGPSTTGRVQKIQSLIQTLVKPPHKLIDDALWISSTERELLGISITSTALDTCKTVISTHQCKDVVDGYKGKVMLGVEIKTSREHLTKKGKSAGKKMAFLSITDNSATLNNVVCFAEMWEKYSHMLYTGATVVIEGKSERDSLIVNRVISI